ncbi:MAG TPA: DinB family protein [Gemmatimonadaceae bacterium]|nr:DinB family protein [Gemmatimonadaceae bacterium]
MITCGDHLSSLRATAGAYVDEVHELAEGLDEEQLAGSSEPGRWSMAQCFEHLVATAKSYHPRISAAIDRHPSSSASAMAYRPTWIGRKFVDAMRDTTGRRRYKAPRPFRPSPQPAAGSAERLAASIRELDTLLARASGADIVRARVASPVVPLLKLNLGEALELQVVHIARHLAQARRVREHLESTKTH